MTTSFRERSGLRWIRADLHLHTPASEDYAEPDISYLDILKEAEQRGLELIAFTDHNSVYGYEQFQREVEFLRTLCNAGRLTAEERTRFEEYDRLLARITILPGFEFTSHYGAHILGIFPPNKPLSLIEATLIQLGVPADRLKEGACGIPDTRHVTDAYEIIARAGGLVIAAHANGPNGVITETLRMGTSGQARVAATQSQYLSALEFINYYTDHDKFTSPAFYNGKTDHYERRMFCIQGSDAHRLRRLSDHEIHAWHKHGIGDRYIELLMPDNSFEALQELFGSKDFDRVRVPKRDQKQWEVDALRFGATSERQILCNIESNADAAAALWKDVAALANMGGGVLTVGCEPGGQVLGVARPDVVSEALRQSIETNLEQQPYISFELISYEGRDVLRVEVKADSLPPYLSKDGVVYVRRDNKTVVANRSEMMQLCRRALAEDGNLTSEDDGLEMPRSGVEIVDDQYRGGIWYYEVRDLRTTAGVTRDKAQGLWAYAISRHEDLREKRIDLHSQVRWRGRLGVWRAYRQGNRIKYDLVHRDANGVINHVFYGVSDWGLGDDWSNLLVERRDDATDSEPPVYDNEVLPLFNDDDPTPLPELGIPWGERRCRWRGPGSQHQRSIGRAR
ncbi:MAG: PHP domain-containing protein [Blastochloris sp.]|nr:PHP domain-containing protein [Blastochloris sp.]